VRFLLAIGVLLLVIATVFSLQNTAAVTLVFLGWRLPTTLALAVIGAALAGGVIVYLASLVTIGELRARLRAAESRLREGERERTERPAEPRA